MRYPLYLPTLISIALAAALCRAAPAEDQHINDANAEREQPEKTDAEEEKTEHPDQMPSREELDRIWREVKAERDWEKGREAFHAALRAAVIHIDDIERLLVVTERIYFRYRVCRYFPEIQESILDRGPRERFIDWLLENEGVTRRLVFAIDDRDDAPKVFGVLFDLVTAQERGVIQFPELAVAYAVVHDRATYSPEAVRDDFRYFTSRAADLTINPRDLSVDLARFLVDGRSTTAEKEWVFTRRFRLKDPEEVYKSIQLRVLRLPDDGRGRRPHIALEHIHNFGGGPSERAHFTVEAARALGAPAAHMRLDAATGESFTWPGYIQITRQGWEWKETAGDQTGNVTAVPAVTDAPSRPGVYTRAELQRMARLAGLPPDSREARPMHVARRLVELAEAISAPSDPAAFLPGRRGDDPEAARAAFRLLRESIDKDPASLRAWRATGRLAGRYPDESRAPLHDLFRILEAPRRHPDLARDLPSRIEAFRLLSSGVEDRSIQREMLTRMQRAMRGAPPDFIGRIELMIAEHIRQDSRENAYDRISRFLNANPQAGPVALDMLERLTDLGRELGRVDPTIATHRSVYNRLPHPGRGFYAAWTLRYQVGRKLEALYKEIGRDRDAAEIQRSLNVLIQ